MNCLFISGVYLWFSQAWAERPSHGSQGCSSQGWWVGFPKVRGIGKGEISKHSHILAKVTVSCLALLCLSGLEPSSNLYSTLDLNLSPQRRRGPHLCSSYQPLFCSEAGFLVLLASAKHCHTWVLTLTVPDAAGLNHGWLYRHIRAVWVDGESCCPLMGRGQGSWSSCSMQDNSSQQRRVLSKVQQCLYGETQ